MISFSGQMRAIATAAPCVGAAAMGTGVSSPFAASAWPGVSSPHGDMGDTGGGSEDADARGGPASSTNPAWLSKAW